MAQQRGLKVFFFLPPKPAPSLKFDEGWVAPMEFKVVNSFEHRCVEDRPKVPSVRLPLLQHLHGKLMRSDSCLSPKSWCLTSSKVFDWWFNGTPRILDAKKTCENTLAAKASILDFCHLEISSRL